MTDADALYQLQCLDSAADKKRDRLADVEVSLGGNEAIQEAQGGLDEATATAQRWRRQQRALELDVQGLSDKIAGSEKLLYGGTVGNPKELADLQAEASSLRRRRQELEDNLLEAMVAYDEANGAQEQAQEKLDDLEAQWQIQQVDLTREHQQLLTEIEQSEHQRASVVPRIDPGVLGAYRDLRQRKRGRAVALERDGFCGVCGITIPPSDVWELRHNKLVQCSNCERFIVRT